MRALPESVPLGRAPRIRRQVARRIDRLARRAHRWHRHAHHPLCAAYAGELVRLGRRTRVCRGCAFAFGGALLGAGVGLAGSSLGLERVPWWAALAAVPLAVFAAGVHARHKALTRGVPALALAGVFALGLSRGGLPGLVLAFSAGFAAVWGWSAYRRRGPNRSPCAGCPEGPPQARCSGFARIVRSERAFQRLANRWLPGF